jgi:HEAT repeat protein
MCSAPDRQDFTVFDQEALPGILIEIILHDPPDAEYHERVVVSAIKALGAMHVDAAVPVLIEKSSEYPTTCIYWLADYAHPDAVDTITGFLDNDDPSVRYEAADALGRLKAPDESTGDEYIFSLTDALMAAVNRKKIEVDPDVLDAFDAAILHLMDIILKPGTN